MYSCIIKHYLHIFCIYSVIAWNNWNPWSVCSYSCGGGISQRTRNCTTGRTSDCGSPAIEFLPCNTVECNDSKFDKISAEV